jgi:hypothetical protein
MWIFSRKVLNFLTFFNLGGERIKPRYSWGRGLSCDAHAEPGPVVQHLLLEVLAGGRRQARGPGMGITTKNNIWIWLEAIGFSKSKKNLWFIFDMNGRKYPLPGCQNFLTIGFSSSWETQFPSPLLFILLVSLLFVLFGRGSKPRHASYSTIHLLYGPKSAIKIK